MKKISFRIVGAVMLLSYLLLIGWYIYFYTLPYNGGSGTIYPFYGFLLLAIPAVFLVSGLARRPLIDSKPVLAGVLTLTCGLVVFLMSISSVAVWFLLIVAGIRLIAASKPAPPRDKRSAP